MQVPMPLLNQPPDDQVRVFESRDHVLDEEATARLAALVKDADLAAPPVALPDFHQEKNMEAPCSIAVATREFIRPTLSNAAVNCGMALISLDVERPSESAITSFYARIRESMPAEGGSSTRLSGREVMSACIDGSSFATDRFQLDPAELARVEEGGRMDLDPYGGGDAFRRELPALIVQLARLRFGTVGPSNHFIELQRVEEVFEPRIAELLGIRPGQITLQFHAGGGVLTGLVGRMFGRRTDYPRKHRAIMSLAKPAYHLITSRSLSEIRGRRALYFSGSCPPIPRHSREGDRYMLANAAAMNYGFAFRLAVYARLRQIAEQTFGASSELIVDSPHDTLYEEEIAGAPALVHRYKVARSFPASRMRGRGVLEHTGQPVLIPGTSRTSSFLAVAADGAAGSLYSTSHGTGSIIHDFVRRGLSGPDPQGRETLRFRYSGEAPVVVPQFDDRAVDEAMSILVGHGIIRPVARLRPFAVLT